MTVPCSRVCAPPASRCAGDRTRRPASAGRRCDLRRRERRFRRAAGRYAARHRRPRPARLRDRAAALAARRTVGLIHHPTALETGYTDPRTRRPARGRTRPDAAARTHHRNQRRHRRTPRRRFRRRSADASPWWFPAPTTRRAARARAGRDCAILSVGTLVPRKGHDVLLRALGETVRSRLAPDHRRRAGRDPVHAHALQALAEAARHRPARDLRRRG